MVTLQPFNEKILISYLPWANLMKYLNCHIRKICDLGKYSRNIRHRYFEIIDCYLVV